MNESLLTNKKFTKSVTALVAILALLFFVKLINEIKPNTVGDEFLNTITVSGSGEVTAVPDIAVINISISKEASTASEATEMLNTSINEVLAYLLENQIEEKDIKSEYGGIQPKYERENVYCITYPCPAPKTKIVAYTATQNITIKVRVADNANNVRSGLADLGITNISGPTFSVDDEDLLEEEARAKAIADARQKAKKLSSDLGVKLGRVVGFYEEGESNYPIAYSGAMYAMDSMEFARESVPTLPKGEDKIISNVNITYRIK